MFLLFLSSLLYADTLKVAVLDTGLNLKDERFTSVLCKSGHANFSREAGIEDKFGHGTHVTGLIKQYAKNADYCLMIIKFIGARGEASISSEVYGIEHAINNGAKIINISSGGKGFNEYESLIIEANPKVKFIVAAGNESSDIESNHYYPAYYSRYFSNVYVVGALNEAGNISSQSNYGALVKFWELGDNVMSTWITGYKELSGTSMATGIFTGKMINKGVFK